MLSNKDYLQTAAIQNGSYNLKVCVNRGNIYDCNNESLLENEKTNMLVVVPDLETPSILNKILNKDQMDEVLNKLRLGKPFCVDIGDKFVSSDSLRTFKVKKRINNGMVAPHILGYLDSKGNGVCGIEKSFNDYLNNTTKGTLNVRYEVDALGRLLPNKNVTVEDNTSNQSGGVALNLDKRIQDIAQSAAEKYMKKGAILITEVPNCEIRACVSMPSFLVSTIDKCLNDDSKPLLNRAFQAYNIGSVFKLVTAAKALESNHNLGYYDCKGEIEIDKAKFHCHNNKSHGLINIVDALAYSCNTFFVNLAKTFDPEEFLNFIKRLGFGKTQTLAPDLVSFQGRLPTKEILSQSRYISNLSFGQGVLLTTPIQVAGLINTIASDGFYTEPKLVKGLLNEKMELIEEFYKLKRDKIFSKETSLVLKNGMKASLDKGTGQKAKPVKCLAALKTGTAQTGIRTQDNRMILQGWCAGFFPFDKPKYSVVVFVEDAESGGQSCGPIFKKIIDEMYNDLPEIF